MATAGTDGVLVVDDDDDIRQTLAQCLSDNGYRTYEADSGKEAFRQLRQGIRPCLILLDLMMPQMDGVEFLQHREGEVIKIPVVILTAFDRPLGKYESVMDYMRKPFKVDDLLEEVKRYC